MKHAKHIKFAIYDWAGNQCLTKQTFDDFEDAWGFIYDTFRHLSDDEAEQEFQEYEVLEA